MIWVKNRDGLCTKKDRASEGTGSAECFSVQKHHLDTNHHVNNCQYIRMAADHLPEDFKVGQLRAEYKRQAVLDNVIIPEVYMTENKETVVLNAEDKEPYAVVEFTK